MDPNQLINIVGTIGFPAVVAWYLLQMAGKFLDRMTDALTKQAEAMEKLADAQMELKSAIQLLEANCNRKQGAA